jgi:uncharacterized protein YkwD
MIFTTLELAIFDEINRRRIACGKTVLRPTDKGCEDARKHSIRMAGAGRLYHDTTGGFGENILSISYKSNDTETAHAAVEAWMSSTTGHRENLLNGSYVCSGVGIYQSGSTSIYYVTQRFYIEDCPHWDRPIQKYHGDSESHDRWSAIEF